ncbi:MAG: class I SAM-dependent methyltransferase [Dehalococcoidia bacterium]|nr:class I SAM-dependent methyltransferase [Dehalococcoidia bacterium]
MARLEGVAKAQYYPTPASVMERVAGLVRPRQPSHRRAVRLLDPCCGTGSALRQLADALGGETYGIELEAGRAEESRRTVDHVIGGSAFAVRIANEAFSCLFLNPPYDEGVSGKRLEHSFLTTFTRALAPAGLLVYIVQQTRLAQSARFLSAHYENLHCYRFPDPEYAAFRQVVLLGRKRKVQAVAPEQRSAIERWSMVELPVLPEVGTISLSLDLPSLLARPVVFASQFTSPEEAASEARYQGLWTNAALVERLWPSDERSVRPLMPLRRGHLALMLAAGFLNNLVLEDGDRRVLVRGRITKVRRPVESADPGVEVEREYLCTSVVMLDLVTGDFEDIDQGGDLAEAAS